MEHNTIDQEKIHIPTNYEHSDRISSTRKALFPSTTDDSNSDLGPMSPLSDTNSIPTDYECSKSTSEELKTFKNYFASLRSNINNYVIIGNKYDETGEVDHTEEETSVHTLTPHHWDNSNSSATTFSSPMHLKLMSPDIATICETPLKESPTKNLKTPHDTSSSNTKVPKLIRKSNGEFLHDIETGKHNFSPTNSPCSKMQKLDNNVSKMSKVRTALFPDISLPTRSFYPKQDKKVEKPFKSSKLEEVKSTKKTQPMYLCNRRAKTRNRFGQINGGVRHKIRKPKQKLPVKISVKKAAMTVIESSFLVEYIKDMNMLTTKAIPKLIKPLDNVKESKDMKDRPIESKETENNEQSSLDCNKKFFKICPNKNKMEVEKENVLEKCTNDKRSLDALDFINDNEQDLIVPSLDNIIEILDEENMFPTNQIVLKASNTISDSDNSILFHHPHGHSKHTNCKERKRKLDNKENESVELLLSPTSQMCDMTSGLAINSPKRAKLNITNIIDQAQDAVKSINIFNKLSSASVMEKQKLFPVFYPSLNGQNKEAKTDIKTGGLKKWKSLPQGQMLLDAGQKRFGFTQCPECEIVYHMGDPNDEIMHWNYHNAKNVFNFKGWKNENVVGSLADARIVKVSPGDPKIWWRKVKDLADIINRDLGYYEVETTSNIENTVVFLYIKNKQIVGCIIAEPKLEGYKMLSCFEGIDVCSTEAYPVKCGISRIWVSLSNRRQGVGAAMMECVRMNFSYGYVLRRDEMALSSPSELGKFFAKKYFQTDNYLIYTS